MTQATKISFSFKVISFLNRNKIDILTVILLGYLTFLTSTLLIQNNGVFMYDIDSYDYYFLAKLNSEGLEASSSPFILFLSAMYQISSIPDTLLFLRLASIIFTIQLVLFIYLIARKMLNPFFSLTAAIVVSFTPILTTYSITLHNDIFALSMGFTALYFMIRPKFFNIIIAIFFIIIAALSRIDTAIIFSIPLIISVVFYVSNKIKVRALYIFPFAFIYFILIDLVLVANPELYPSRFDPTEKIILFLNFETLNIIWNEIIEITKIEVINTLFLIFMFGLSGLLLLNYGKKIYRIIITRNYNYHEDELSAIFLIIVFFVSLGTSAAFHIGYTITPDDTIIINQITASRYLLANQTLLLFGFTIMGLVLTKYLYEFGPRTITNWRLKIDPNNQIKKNPQTNSILDSYIKMKEQNSNFFKNEKRASIGKKKASKIKPVQKLIPSNKLTNSHEKSFINFNSDKNSHQGNQDKNFKKHVDEDMEKWKLLISRACKNKGELNDVYKHYKSLLIKNKNNKILAKKVTVIQELLKEMKN